MNCDIFLEKELQLNIPERKEDFSSIYVKSFVVF